MSDPKELSKMSIIQFDLPFMINLPDGSYYVRMDDTKANVILSRTRINKSAGIPDGVQLPPDSYVEGDRWGKFQFSKIVIEFIHEIYLKVHILLPDFLIFKSAEIVNRILDICRGVKGDHYPRIIQTDIFSFVMSYVDIENMTHFYTTNIINDNVVFTGGAGKPNIQNVDLIKNVLENDSQLPVFQELINNAYDDFFYGDYRIAVVEAITAMESFVIYYISSKYEKTGKSKEEINRILETGFMNRLDHIRILSGGDIKESELYLEWKTQAYDLRNNIIHEGKKVSWETCRMAVTKTIELIKTIQKLDK